MKFRHSFIATIAAAVAAVLPLCAFAVSDYRNAEFTPIYISKPIGVDRLLPEYALQQPPDWVPTLHSRKA
ncbi:MAG TPA: hypothetical protein VJ984_01180 [Xanthomonadales bacterium]|nr:hypothetical protein [Xanthomonadales bacterium]